MKKFLILLLFLPILSFAKSFLISDIPIPKSYIQNLDPYPCDEDCMQEYINKDMLFSFLSHAGSKLENEQHNELRRMYVSVLNLGSTVNNNKIRIALLLPYKRIGKYASSTTNATFAYLITKNQSFDLKSYKIETESIEDIRTALNSIEEDGFSHVIAPLTLTGANSLIALNPTIHIYFPTINKQDVTTQAVNFYFGGIDYKAQSDLLLKEAVSPLIIFHDTSAIGKKLAQYEENAFKYESPLQSTQTNESQTYIKPIEKVLIQNRKTIKYPIARNTTNLKHYLANNEDINSSSCFINTPVVKTSMVLSQLTLYDGHPKNILSTQINYDPLILSMTQYVDREKMIIANSITEHNSILIQTNALLSNDIEYDWINYTTTVAIDYFFHTITNAQREYNVKLINNQMVYPIELLQPSLSRFLPYTSIHK